MTDSANVQNAAIPGAPSTPPPGSVRWVLPAAVFLGECAVLLALGIEGPLAGIFVMGGLAFLTLAWLRPTAAWLTVALLVPFSLEIMIPGTGSALQAPTEPMILLLEGIWLFRLLQGSRILLSSRRLTRAVSLILALAFVSCFYTRHPVACLKASANLAWYVIFGYFLALLSLRNIRDLRRFAAVFSVPAAAAGGYYLVNLARGGLSVESSNVSALPFFAEHGTFSAYLCFAFPMAAVSLLWAKKSIERFFFACVGFMTLAGILFSLTRAAWLGFFGMFATFLYYSLKSRRSRGFVVVILVLALIVMGATLLRSTSMLSQHAQSVVNLKTNISNLERLNRWAAAWDMFRAHPLGGVGFGMYKHHYYEFRRIQLATTESSPKAGAHSIYLSVLSETGVVGAAVGLFFAIAFFSVVRRTLHLCRDAGARGQPVAQMTVALTAGLVGYAIHGLFNYYPSWDKVLVPAWTFVGAVAVCARIAKQRAKSITPVAGNSEHAS